MGIVAAGKSSEQIELLQLDKSGIKVAEYLTPLPDRELLKQKLHQAVIRTFIFYLLPVLIGAFAYPHNFFIL